MADYDELFPSYNQVPPQSSSLDKFSDDIVPLKELFPEIIAKSEIMFQVLRDVCKIAKSSSAVLIRGESGTGKELIAAAIHRLSPRARFPYLAINCSAIPEELLEAELFGYEKGAFTGAEKKRIGYFGIAHHGTIFLDEIGDMPTRLQAKLLRVLQEKKYTPIGSNEVKDVDVRIIAATHVDLETAVKTQQFRLDLFYRLNVLPIKLPSLRERPEDIPVLLEYFLKKSNEEIQLQNPDLTSVCWFDKHTISILCQWPWPGNVRHLQNLVERLVTLKLQGAILPKDLPQEPNLRPKAHKLDEPEPDKKNIFYQDFPKEKNNSYFSLPILSESGFSLPDYITMVENQYILQALEKTQNNKNKAASMLGLRRTTLIEKMKKRKSVFSSFFS